MRLPLSIFYIVVEDPGATLESWSETPFFSLADAKNDLAFRNDILPTLDGPDAKTVFKIVEYRLVT